MRKIVTAAVILLALPLAACQHAELPPLNPNDKSTVCQALVGPIKYNTQNPKSQRYAGALLGLDIKQRNQIGQALRCPQYR